jgi:hypothetical protein
MRERDIEKYLVKKIKGIGGLCYKFQSPGNAGVPDRICIIAGRVFFVELKAPTKKPTALQAVKIKEIRERGGVVFVIDTLYGVDNLIKRFGEVIGK